MREQIEVSTMMMRREEITFEYLKSYVLAWVFRHAAAPKGHSRDDPMQVDALSDKAAEKAPEKSVSPEQAAWSDPSWADSLGKSYAKGFGKAASKLAHGFTTSDRTSGFAARAVASGTAAMCAKFGY